MYVTVYNVERNQRKDHERLEWSHVDVNVVLLLQQGDDRRLTTQALQHHIIVVNSVSNLLHIIWLITEHSRVTYYYKPDDRRQWTVHQCTSAGKLCICGKCCMWPWALNSWPCKCRRCHVDLVVVVSFIQIYPSIPEIGEKMPSKCLFDHKWSCCDLQLWPLHLKI